MGTIFPLLKKMGRGRSQNRTMQRDKREWCMKVNFLPALVLGSFLMMYAPDGHATDWVKNNVDVPTKNVKANYYDSDSVKTNGKTLSWTEKFVLTSFGEQIYTKKLSQYPACQQNIAKKGSVAYNQIDFEIKEGKFRLVSERNYNKADELVCTDKDMGTELDKSWKVIQKRSPMYERYYIFVTKFKLKDL